MKTLHIHVSVDDISRSIGFYSTLFATKPSVQKSDYAKWMLEDPRVNFAISRRGVSVGLDHLGIQVETSEELETVQERLTKADGPVLDEGDVTCCYSRSRKSWIADPSGISWEAFLPLGDSGTYENGEDVIDPPVAHPPERDADGACCSAEAKDAALAGKSACCGPRALVQNKTTRSASVCC